LVIFLFKFLQLTLPLGKARNMDFLRFLLTKKFLRHLGLAAAISLILVLGTLLWLKIYTHHGKTILVPDLAGLTLEEVEDVEETDATQGVE